MGQVEHTEAPALERYVPAAQFAQAEVEIIAVPVPYVPAAQREHTEIPVSELYVPVGQFVHTETPEAEV